MHWQEPQTLFGLAAVRKEEPEPDAAGFKVKNYSLLHSFRDCKPTDGDIDLLRPRIMFKGIRLRGAVESGSIKRKHFFKQSRRGETQQLMCFLPPWSRVFGSVSSAGQMSVVVG